MYHPGKDGDDLVTAMCIEVANELIKLTNEYNEKPQNQRIIMTGKRLQKLLYFSEVLFMLKNGGTPMLEDAFVAWPSGPVIPEVYRKFMMYQRGVMMPAPGANESLTTEQLRIIHKTFNDTAQMDTSDLVLLSHVKGGPWDVVYQNGKGHEQEISKTDIYRYYQENPLFLGA